MIEKDARRGACLVVGTGDGLGASIARAFAADGFAVAMTRRPRHMDRLDALARDIAAAGGRAKGYGVDARSEDEMIALFDQVEHELGPLQVVVFNIGANVRFNVADTTARVYSKVWEMAAFAGFLAGREAAKRMVPRGAGTILFTGATASVRGGAGFSAFAGAKNALRALAQSMARELGPQGVHVAHIVIDGAVDGTFTRENRADAADLLAREEILDPDEIARNYIWLHHQKRSAWTHELDLRPWKERW